MAVVRTDLAVRGPVRRGRRKPPISALRQRLRDYVVYSAVLGPAEMLSVLLGMGGAAVVAVGAGHYRTAGFALLGLGVTALVALLWVNRVEWRRRDESERQLLLRYCDILENRHGQSWAVKNWLQEVDIEANGDVRQRISFTVVVLCDLLHFCSFADRACWDWPDRYKRRVKVKVRSVEVGGEGGTRFGFTTAWIDNTNRLKVMMHLNEPAPRGSEVNFLVEVFWPAKCAPLMRGYEADEFLVSFSETIEYARYVITYPPGFSVRVDKLGLTGRDDCSLNHGVNASGRPETDLVMRDIGAYRKVGVRVDLA
ncbi:hypothetical protein [Saccharothrix syringae]|uniref:Uncharacterized protein n=1 Tax=Saccharothrix syringae TaxID=103733 RepID=A0A5Q0HC18_SACSY|nr:hypothetical protein [Saccharothrix syringae]QFZ23786.1 hypothetical protein EKG83_45750 [Saccharothrix syringae]